jgi:predicted nucleic-acid-binding protein
VKGADTNVLVRYIVEDDEDQVRRAVRFLTGECSVENPCFVNRIVICEVVWVLQTAYRYSRDRVAHAVEQLLNTYQLVIEDRDEVSAALSAYRNSGDFADLLVARLNHRFGCEYTATFDRKAARGPLFRRL